MIVKVFTVYDSKAEAYLQPFYMQSKGAAIRAFTDLANDIQHQFYKYSEDFTLFYLGEWDDSNAKFISMLTPSPIGKAVEFKSNPVVEPFALKKQKLSELKVDNA